MLLFSVEENKILYYKWVPSELNLYADLLLPTKDIVINDD
jgi:hypothetical protein